MKCKYYLNSRTNSYTPVDKTGDYFYYIIVMISLSCVVYYLMKNVDNLVGMDLNPQTSLLIQILAGSLLLGMLVHPGYNSGFFTDSLWASAVYADSIALLPFLIKMQKVRLLFSILQECIP